MKLQSTNNHEIFNAVLTNEHPSNVPGMLAIKRADTGTFIALSDIMGVENVPYQLLEVTPVEKTELKKAGITIAENSDDLHNWYQQWNGPK